MMGLLKQRSIVDARTGLSHRVFTGLILNARSHTREIRQKFFRGSASTVVGLLFVDNMFAECRLTRSNFGQRVSGGRKAGMYLYEACRNRLQRKTDHALGTMFCS